MDKEFEKKVRMKRIRAAAVAIIVIAIAAYLIYDMDVEKADYGAGTDYSCSESLR